MSSSSGQRHMRTSYSILRGRGGEEYRETRNKIECVRTCGNCSSKTTSSRIPIGDKWLLCISHYKHRLVYTFIQFFLVSPFIISPFSSGVRARNSAILISRKLYIPCARTSSLALSFCRIERRASMCVRLLTAYIFSRGIISHTHICVRVIILAHSHERSFSRILLSLSLSQTRRRRRRRADVRRDCLRIISHP